MNMRDMLKATTKAAATITTAEKWWKKMLKKSAETAATEASKKTVEKLIKGKKKNIKERLAELKELKDLNLITEAEYQHCRQQLLTQFAKNE
jgi:membrane-bound ClpP family serine protease